MNKFLILSIVLIFGLNPIRVCGKSKNVGFSLFSIEQGLSNSTVFSIVQDRNGAVWMATQDGLNKFDGYNFKIYRNERNNPASIGSDDISTLYVDAENTLWVGSYGMLSEFNKHKDCFVNYEIDLLKNKKVRINSIVEIDNYNLLLATNNGILAFDKKSKRFTFFQTLAISNVNVLSFALQNENVFIGTGRGLFVYNLINKSLKQENTLFSNKTIQSILPASVNKLWIATEGDGLFYYDLATKETRNFRNNPTNKGSICSNFIRTLAFDSQKNLWVGTFNGLSILSPGSTNFDNYVHIAYQDESLSQNSIRAICMDNQGGMWLGTYYGGVNYYHPLKNRFQHLVHDPYKSLLNDRVISCIAECNLGNIWIGTNDNGIDIYNPNTGKYQYINKENNPRIKSNNIKCFLLSADKQHVYVGIHGGGLVSVNLRTYEVTNVGSGVNAFEKNVYSIVYDKSNTLWISTLDGICTYNEQTKQIVKQNIPQLGSDYCYYLKFDSNQQLWIGTDRSLIVYNPATRAGRKFNSIEYNKTKTTGVVNSIYEDSHKHLWICTNSGLSLYQGKGNFKTFLTDDGLPSNVVYGILEDSYGRYWISTNNGLSCYNAKKNEFRSYQKMDGLPFNQFNKYSFCKTLDGKMYFGGLNGIATFYPEILLDNPFAPKPHIAALRILGKIVKPDDETKILSADIAETNRIELNPDQTNFSIEIGVINYLSGNHNLFMYKLEGLDSKWIQTSDNRVISYSNLSHGKYIFRLRAANNDGKWNNDETTLIIVVLPHWWQTWWAIILFAIIAFTIAYYVLKFFRQRHEMDLQLKHERLEKERMEEINQMKMSFFINISHEFKTPLTLILSPLQDVIERVTDKWQKSQLSNIQNNANKLLHMVNQLMDYRRAELGVFELKVVRTNPLEKLNEIYRLFEKLAKQRNINFKIENQLSDTSYIIDINYLDLILNNLVSNAFKFTPDNGEINIRVYEDVNDFVIEVEDTGVGIPQDKLDLIFDRFYQVNKDHTGSGIGLSLVKRLVDLHKAKIAVRSEVGKGTTFTVSFSQREDLYDKVSEEIQATAVTESGDGRVVNFLNTDHVSDEADSEGTVDTVTGKVLIIEDNTEISEYLKGRLSPQYVVVTAENGIEGLDIVNEGDIDLVITDVMMPEMDGIKFCRLVKQNIKTCHIPIIMLSAKTDTADQLKGLSVGADDYVPKPFTYAILNKKINNMLIARRRSIEFYSKSKEIQPEKITFNAMDEQLLTKALKIVNDNIDNVEFSADHFCSEMCMSRSNLHLKLKAITGESTIDFIRKVRFNKACELLLDGRYSVADISTMVGFNSPSYFTTSFKKYFGYLPSEYTQNR